WQGVNEIASRSDGTFVSYPFPSGEYVVEVRKDGYKPASARVRIVPHQTTRLDVMLAPATPPIAIANIKVVDENGRPLAASVVFDGPGTPRVDVPPSGEANDVKLMPGEYIVRFEAAGFLAKQRPLSAQAGQKYSLDVTMRRRPRRATARLTG